MENRKRKRTIEDKVELGVFPGEQLVGVLGDG